MVFVMIFTVSNNLVFNILQEKILEVAMAVEYPLLSKPHAHTKCSKMFAKLLFDHQHFQTFEFGISASHVYQACGVPTGALVLLVG